MNAIVRNEEEVSQQTKDTMDIEGHYEHSFACACHCFHEMRLFSELTHEEMPALNSLLHDLQETK